MCRRISAIALSLFCLAVAPHAQQAPPPDALDGVVLGVGFGMVGALVNQVYEGKGSSYFLINGVNAVIAYGIVAGILSVWD